MSAERLSRAIPLSMVLLMVFSTTLIHLNPATELDFELDSEVKFTSLNQNTTLNVYNENGSSSSLTAEVPIDHTVDSIDLSLSPDVIAYNDAFSWSSISDWTAAGASLDQIEVNKSTGLEMLPRIWNWDFESGSFSSDWTLTSSNSNNWAIQTSTVLQGSRTPKAGTVSHNQESAMHLDVSALPAASGTFRYRVSSESNYDYLLFCKDNSGCTRYGGYTNRWSGSLGTATQSFSISAATQTLTWKYIKDGSVNSYSDTAWVDDITIVPSGGSGGDTANWTSAKFGPEIAGTHGSDSARYGISSIDATLPTGSNLRASIIDGSTGAVIPGYEDLDPHWFDLGQINSELHPSLRLKLFFDASAGGASPIVHKIHMNHRYGTSFSSSPVDAGWSLSGMTWNNGQISGSSGTSATSPLFTSHRPISQMRFSSDFSGSFSLEASLDGGSWQSVNSNGISTFTDFGRTLQFRITCNSCSLTDVTMEMIGGHLPTHPRFDIGLDGWNEWEVIHPHVSEWGWQNRFSNGQLSADLNWVAPGLRQVGIMLPKDGIESFSVYLSPFTTMESVDVALRVGSTEIGSKNIVFSKGSASYELTASEIQSMNSQLSNAGTYWGVGDEVEFALVMLEIDGTSGSLRVGGLSAISRPSVNLSFPVDSAVVISMNQALGNAPIQSQNRLVSLPILSSTIGAYTARITGLSTAESVVLEDASLSNFSHLNAVTPSWQWMELNLSYDMTMPVHADFVLLTVETDHSRAFYEFPVDGSSFSMTRLDGTSSPLQFKDSNGGAKISINESISKLDVSIPIQTAATLEDSSDFKLSASLYMQNSPPSIPFIQMAGQSSTGVENDIQLIDWQVINELGHEIPESMSYLQSSSPISIEVDLGFEGLTSIPTKNPRSGDVRVHLMENGVEKLNTTTIEEGTATFALFTPTGTGDVTYQVVVETLANQSFVTELDMNRTFTVDSLNPQVINQNIERYDHRTPSPNQVITIEVFDRPVLPTNIEMMIWREWIDDVNSDGVMDEGEYVSMMMQPPSDLSTANGNYSLVIDDTQAEDGDLVSGYLIGADPAGNEILGAGEFGIEKHLFMYQVLPDGPPSLPAEGGFAGSPDGRMAYLHPGVDYSFSVHIIEPNGWSDIGNLRLQLASNSVSDNLAIEWSADTGVCNVLSQHMSVEGCGVRAWTGRLSPYNPDLEFYVDFQLNWTLPSEGDMRWEPSIEVTDRSGQGAWLSLPQLRWRYSPEVAIDADSIILDIGSGTFSEEGAWISPASSISLQGMVYFPGSGSYPTSPFTLRILMDGEESILQTENGFWSTTIAAPLTSGSYPLTVELIDLPTGANDITSSADTLRWIVVDPTGPEPVDIVSPRPDSPIPIESLDEVQIELKISELEQIDESSVQLHWKIVRGPDARVTPMALGDVDMTIQGGNLAGQAIIAIATLNLGESIPEQFHTDELYLHIWVTGQDMAGNSMLQPGGTNNADYPFSTWRIEGPQAELELEDSVTYSRTGDISVGQNVMVTISVRNDGEVAGTAYIHLTEFHLDESNNRELTALPIAIQVSSGNRTLEYIDWEPTEEGRQWIQVTMEDGTVVNGPTLNVVEAEESSFLGSVFDGVNLVWTLLFIGLMILLGSVILIALRSGGSNESALYDTDDIWEGDEYEEYEEESHETFPDPTPVVQNVVVPATITAPHEFPLDYADDTVKYIIQQYQIHDVNGFLLYAKNFDADNNGYLKQSELEHAAKSFVESGAQAQPIPVQDVVVPSTITAPYEFPLDYADDTVKHIIQQHQIHDVNGFLLYAKNFDADNNGYLKQTELEHAAKSFVESGAQAQPTSSGPPAPIDLENMTPEQLAWYEQAKKWGGYYDEAGNWNPL